MTSCISSPDSNFSNTYTMRIQKKILALKNEISDYEHILNVFAKYEDEISRLNKRIEFYEERMEKCGKLAELKAAGENYELKNRITELEKELSEKNEELKETKTKHGEITSINNDNNTIRINGIHAV